MTLFHNQKDYVAVKQQAKYTARSYSKEKSITQGDASACLCIPVHACLCIPLGICCVSTWRWGWSKMGREIRARPLLSRKSLPIRGKEVWLEVDNCRAEDNQMGAIRMARFSRKGKSPVGFCECSSTRTAHTDYISRHKCCSLRGSAGLTYCKLTVRTLQINQVLWQNSICSLSGLRKTTGCYGKTSDRKISHATTRTVEVGIQLMMTFYTVVCQYCSLIIQLPVISNDKLLYMRQYELNMSEVMKM